MESTVQDIVDDVIFNFVLEIKKNKLPKISEYNLFLIHKFGDVIQDDIILENDELYIIDDNKEKYVKIDKNWNVEAV